ncbi:MAG: carboxypeptidase regulatory-like domain-containing protein [Acidobacteria bacterium]|nr:carboxypeptidase regulatory-like domain-containing protein [Acidobacteriota bacterium]
MGLVVLLFSLLSFTAAAQTITGTIVGTVRDPSSLPVAGASVTLTQPGTGAVRETKTNDAGDFRFTNVPPADYTLAVKAGGFKQAERTGFSLSASETLPIGEIRLEVGSITETVSVVAQGAVVQTASSERSGVITSTQVENIQIRGRNVMSLLTLLPGVVSPNEPEQIARNWAGNVNGNRVDANSLSVDGMGLNQIGAARNLLLSVSQDAVSEVKILLSNYQAEYGRYSGANVQVITKSGTRDFHGLGSYFKRHEQFNANSFFNNRLGIPKQKYRYNTWNYNIGGPIYIPGKLNRNRDKLFFFWSQEFWPTRSTVSGRQVTLPTELERKGDFSQSVDQNGARIPVVDPVTRQPLPNNVIPASRLDANGVALLSVFPLPNFFDTSISARRYNTVFSSGTSSPQKIGTLKIDFNLHPKHQVFTSYLFHSDTSTGWQVPAHGGTNWNQTFMTYATDPRQVVVRYQAILQPTLINELSAGVNGRGEWHGISDDQLAKQTRAAAGFHVPQLRPGINPLGVLPNATFGGIPGAVAISFDNRFPLIGSRMLVMLTDAITKTAGAHIIKGGVSLEREFTTAWGATGFNGIFDFSRNVNNPLDSGHPFANAELGVFSTYQEARSRPVFTNWNTVNEWFVQDAWKVSRRLTLDIGARFYWIGARVQRGNMISGFDPTRFDASKMISLITPATVGGRRVGVNPRTGEAFPAAAIGAIAPGSGLEANGMVVPALVAGYPAGMYDSPAPRLAPRFGFAWDLDGTGKTAIRGGFGVFYNRNDTSSGPSIQPPLQDTPTIFYGTFQTLGSSAGLVFPQAVTGLDPHPKPTQSMNVSLSVQHDIGAGIVLDAGYVSTLGRNQMWRRNINPVPFGANFDPRNADPTNTRVPLPNSFLRPMPGYADVNMIEWAGSSNYHSLQVTMNRRFRKGLDFGASYTWSKTLDYIDDDEGAIAVLVPLRVWNYGLAAFDRTHVFKANFLYSLPPTPWSNALSRWALRDWQISGIAAMSSGAPATAGFSFVNAVDTTGTSSQGARISLTGDPTLPRSERTFERNFRTEVFRPPDAGTIGNSARTTLRLPGFQNWDLSAVKSFPVHERVRVQFRAEFYNAFNHTQFSNFDAAARFDARGAQVNNRFGEMTAARSPRIVQMALRLSF